MAKTRVYRIEAADKVLMVEGPTRDAAVAHAVLSLGIIVKAERASTSELASHFRAGRVVERVGDKPAEGPSLHVEQDQARVPAWLIPQGDRNFRFSPDRGATVRDNPPTGEDGAQWWVAKSDDSGETWSEWLPLTDEAVEGADTAPLEFRRHDPEAVAE